MSSAAAGPPSVQESLVRVRRGLAAGLTAWSAASLVAGGALAALARGGPRLRGAARQCLAWGGIDLAIAVAAHRGADQVEEDPAAAARSLRRLLLVNAALDVGYVAAGGWLVARGRVRGRDVVGDGWAVVVQGTYLLVADVVAAEHLRRTTPV